MSSIEFADGKALTEDEIHQAAANELRTNYFYRDDELRRNWELAYDYYKGIKPARVKASASDALSTDVSDTIEWILPAILTSFIESPDVVRFDPVNAEDQGQADVESDYVHHHFMKRCDGFTKLYCHIKDALLLKNAVFATYHDEKVKNQIEEYQDLTEIELADLLHPSDKSTVRVVEQTEREAPLIDASTGQPLPPMQPGAPAPTETRYDVTLRRFTPEGSIVVENCEPESFGVRMSHNSINLEEARYCRYTIVKTQAELLMMGYDKDQIDQVAAGTRRYWDNEVRWHREDVEREHNSIDGDRNETGDPSQDLIDLHRVYMMLDVDGDGHEEKYMIILGGTHGEVMFDWYEVPENPFTASTPFIAAHKFWGYSLFDKLKKLTDHKTKLLRMLEDNLDLINNPRKKVVRGQASLDDLLTVQPGGLWRVDQVGAVEEVQTPNIASNAFALLEYYDKQRAERSGVDPNAQSISRMMPEESMNHAMERVLSMKEELVGLIVRVFAETGIKNMFLKMRALMIRHYDVDEIVQLRNKWAKINPGNWIERTDTTIVVGLGTGDRIKKQQALLNVYGMQKEAMQMGFNGIVVSPERMNHTIQEYIRVTRLGDPDDYWLDPALLQDQRNVTTARGQEMIRAMDFEQKRQQQARQQQEAQAQAQQAMQQAVQQLTLQVEAMRQEGKTMQEQIRAQQKERDRMAELMKFQAEERRKWAELAAQTSNDQARTAAQVGTTLVQQGVNMEQMERNKGNGAGEAE